MRKLVGLSAFLLSIIFQFSVSAADELVVVVNNKNPIKQMTRSEVIDLFMGKYTAFPNGEHASVVDLDNEQLNKQQFYHLLVGRSLASINAYWSRIRFTGRARPPIQQSSELEVIEYLSNQENAIGYIPKSMLNENLKVVYSFD